MSGARSLAELAKMTAFLRAVKAASASNGPPDKGGPAEALWKEAEDEWRRLWTGLFATLLAERDGTLLEVNTIEGISTAGVNVSVVSRMPTVERSVRRLLGCIKLERMMEERTLADYRGEVENRFRKVHEEAETWLPLAMLASKSIEQCERDLAALSAGGGVRVPNNGSWIDSMTTNLSAIRSGLDSSIVTLKRFKSEFGEPAKEMAFVDSLRPTWNKVDRDFGTWVRRVKPALAVVASGTSLAVVLYMIIGMFLPTSLVLLVLLCIVAFSSAIRYFITRGRLESEIERVAKRFSDLVPRHGGFWTGEQTQLKVMVTSKNGQISQVINGGPPLVPAKRTIVGGLDGLLDSFGFIVGTVLSLLALLTAYFVLTVFSAGGAGPAPVFSAFVKSDGRSSACSVAAGVVQWAGPGRVIINRKVNGEKVLSFIDPRGITGLSSYGRWSSCAEPSHKVDTRAREPDVEKYVEIGRGESGGVVVDEVAASAGQSNSSDVIIIPFIGPVHARCREKQFFGDGSIPDQVSMRSLDMISSALRKCGGQGGSATLLPIIDVQGFASDKEFNCGLIKADGDLNLDLAEHRRSQVLEALGATFDENTGVWSSRGFDIEKPVKNRWNGSFAEMKKEMLFQHHDDPMARYVAIEIVRPSSCVVSSS